MSLQGFFSSLHVFLYRVSNGRVGGRFRGGPVLLLTTTGRKTGRKRTTPLLFARDGNRLAVIASNGGRNRDPSWWTNLRFNPEAEVEIKGDRWSVKAEKANDVEKTRLWTLMTTTLPFYEEYQRKTKRVIPVVILTPSNRLVLERTAITVL
jgi:F420H(2)-dependent quinone reductase